MCEILICVKDRGNTGNLAIDSAMPKEGDVVAVQPDGWAWGDCELGIPVPGNPNGNHDFFRIIKMPNVTVSEASTLLSPELDVDPQNPNPYLQYRAKFIDSSKIPVGALETYWNDDLRTQQVCTLNYNALQLDTIVSFRTPIPFT